MRIESSATDLPIVIIGGGIAGLTAALSLAQKGYQVTVVEQSQQCGGRGKTRQESGWHFNLGAHALYRGGDAYQILKALDLQIKGKNPAVRGAHAWYQNELQPLFGTYLRFSDKIQIPRLITQIISLKANENKSLSVQQWLDQLIGVQRNPLRQFFEFLVRISTYTADFEQLSAEVAIQQLQIGLKANVLYLDQGWQSLIDQMQARLTALGEQIMLSTPIKSLQYTQNAWHLNSSAVNLKASALVLSVPPQIVSKLLSPWPELDLHQQIHSLKPVQAACLDLGLNDLPKPQNKSAFGIDETSYFSVHSLKAQLAPHNGALIHSLWYLRGDEDSAQLQDRLVQRLDRFQPKWNQSVQHQYFYPHLTVTHALALPGASLAGRPAVKVSGLNRLMLAGDWVGSQGWLADASIASGKEAARQIERELKTRSMPTERVSQR